MARVTIWFGNIPVLLGIISYMAAVGQPPPTIAGSEMTLLCVSFFALTIRSFPLARKARTAE